MRSKFTAAQLRRDSTMGIDTKAVDWMIAAHQLKVNPSKGSAVLSFKLGSVTANQAALLGCFGQISGSGVPDEQFFSFPSGFVNAFTHPFSLRDIKGHRGFVSQNVSGLSDSEMFGNAFLKTGNLMFGVSLPNSESLSFEITGQWLVRMILPLRATFAIP
jgi:hypothetical protein